MRNLKRVLGLALASVMVMSMMVIGAGAANYDDFSDKEEIVNKEAVSVLVELGVIAGKDTGDFDPTGIVTRAEMAKMICVVLNGGKDPSLGNVANYSYADTVGHWAAAYIEYCSNLGIVAGDGTGNFNPNATVTGSEAAKMLLVAAGYQSAIEGFTGANWAVGTNVRANQVGLYEDLSVNPSEGLTRDNAAQMVYNALSAYVVTYKYTLVTDGSAISSIPELQVGEKTVLEDKFGVVTVEGIVVANEFANLEGSKAMDEGETRVNVTNNGDGQSTYNDGNNTFKVASGKDVLGQAVTIFVKPSTTAASTSTKGTVIGSVITNSENTVVVDNGRDSLADVADDNKLDLNTAEAGDSAAEKAAATQVANNYGSASHLDTAAKDAAGVRGTVRTLIDNDDDGVVEYVLTETYLLGKVTTYKTDDSIRLNGSSDLDYDAEDVVGFDDVAKGDYVLYAAIGGKLYVEKAESVKGELEAFNANKSLTVDGTKYTTSDLAFYSDAGTLVSANGYQGLDKTATFYLDKSGYVIAVDGTAASSDYAFVMDAATLSGVDAKIEVKVALNDGTVKTYILDEDNSTGITATSKNVLCTYTLGDDNEIALDAVVPTEVSNAAITVKKGSATVTGITGTADAYADDSTVFFYVSDKAGSGQTAYAPATDGITTGTAGATSNRKLNADDVNVYVGKDNVSGLTATTDAAYYAVDGDIKAVVVVTDSVTGTSDYLYLYERLGENSNGGLYNAIIDGEMVKDIVVTTDPGVGLYSYTTTSKGYYKTIGTTGVAKNIVRLDGKSVILDDGNEYTLQSDTVYAAINGSKTELDAVLSVGDYVAVKANSEKDIEAIYVVMPYDVEKVTVELTSAGEAAIATPATLDITIGEDTITITGTSKDSVNADTFVTYVAAPAPSGRNTVGYTVNDSPATSTALTDGDTLEVTYTRASDSATMVKTYTISIPTP